MIRPVVKVAVVKVGIVKVVIVKMVALKIATAANNRFIKGFFNFIIREFKVYKGAF
jgi:hypothetical protein